MTTLERELRNLVPTTKDPPWQKLCLSARLELHPGRLNKRLESALSAIQHRMNALGTKYDGAPTAEHHALADAIDRLRMRNAQESGKRGHWGRSLSMCFT